MSGEEGIDVEANAAIRALGEMFSNRKWKDGAITGMSSFSRLRENWSSSRMHSISMSSKRSPKHSANRSRGDG